MSDNMFGGLTSNDLEEGRDVVGGSFLKDSNIYDATIKVAYGTVSKKGAKAVALELDIDGTNYRETVYVTNAAGENFYLTPDKKKAQLPGFNLINDMCRLAADLELHQVSTEDRTLKIYDADAKQELPKSVPVLVDLIGKKVKVALLRKLENKTEKNDQTGEYDPIPDTRESNEVSKFLFAEDGRTVLEISKGVATAVFAEAWLKANEGKTRDLRKIKDGDTSGSGSGRPDKGAPTAGGEKKATNSLFKSNT